MRLAENIFIAPGVPAAPQENHLEITDSIKQQIKLSADLFHQCQTEYKECEAKIAELKLRMCELKHCMNAMKNIVYKLEELIKDEVR